MPKQMITQYVRRGPKSIKVGDDGNKTYGMRTIKCGVLVAHKNENGNVYFGWSLAHKSDRENGVFDRNRGLDIALNRAKLKKKLKIPQSMSSDFENFLVRCKKYFKDVEFANLT